MNHINDLFSKLKSSFAAHADKKATVVAVCGEAGIDLKPEQVDVNGAYVKLNTNPSAKSMVFMKKAQILEALKGKTKPEILDIR